MNTPQSVENAYLASVIECLADVHDLMQEMFEKDYYYFIEDETSTTLKD